ncbi:MAG: hypothetical protein AAGC60_25455 [Acidobacteriota bacterium]
MYRTLAMLYTGGHKGTEAEFGRCAEEWGIPEVTFTWGGHEPRRERGLRTLSEKELAEGDVSMAIVSKHMGRTYARADKIRKVFQGLFHAVNNAYHVFAVGWIQADDTVKGGTGWGVELAKLFNREVSVYDQDRRQWFTWVDRHWTPDEPTIPERAFAATGTRNLTDDGKRAIRDLFERSFGAPGAANDTADDSAADAD